MEKKVIVIGSLNYDIILKQERLPKLGETYAGNSVTYCGGGKGANQAVQAAKLGVPTYMVGCIGTDMMGDFLKATAEEYGVHTDYLRRVSGNSGMSAAHVLHDGELYATIIDGANAQVNKADIDALDGFINEGDIAVFQLEIPIPVVEYAIRFCKERGCTIMLNGAPAAPVAPDILKLVDVFIVNEGEAGFYCGAEIATEEDAVREILKMSEALGNICIFTLGKQGSVVCDGKRYEVVPSRTVPAVETTGAGDSFIGGVCYALLDGSDIFEAVKFATCCSAKTVCKIGGQPAMPTLEEVSEIL